MRFLVLLIGLAGVALAGFVGYMFLDLQTFLNVLKEVGADNAILVQIATSPMEHMIPKEYVPTNGEVGLFLMIAAGYGLLGVAMSFFRCGWQGAFMIIIPVVAAAFMNPFTVAFTGLLALAGLMSLLVFPEPITEPAPAPTPPKKSKKDDDDD